MARYWGFRIASWVVPLVPRWFAYRLAAVSGTLIWMFARKTRARAMWNFAHVPSLRDNPARLRAATRGVFYHMALNYVDFLRGKHLTDADLLSNWTIENQESFDEAMARGVGLIMLGAHYGNFEFAVSRLGAMGHKIIAPAEHMQPERVFRLFCELREHHNLRLVPGDTRESLRELLDALKRGDIVVFAADRLVLGSSMEVPFFGTPAQIAIAPFALALRANVPVFTAYSYRQGMTQRHGAFFPLPVGSSSESASDENPDDSMRRPTRRAATPEDIQWAMRSFLGVLESYIEQHPEQWVSALARVWDQ